MVFLYKIMILIRGAGKAKQGPPCSHESTPRMGALSSGVAKKSRSKFKVAFPKTEVLGKTPWTERLAVGPIPEPGWFWNWPKKTAKRPFFPLKF
jgi:hypothetical protein